MVGKVNLFIAIAHMLIDAYSSMDLDWTNFHWYESGETLQIGSNSSSTMLAEVMSYLKLKTGKPLLTNECGQRSSSSAIIRPFLQKMTDYGVEFIIWYDGDGTSGPALGLNDLTAPFALYPNGLEFKAFVNSVGTASTTSPGLAPLSRLPLLFSAPLCSLSEKLILGLVRTLYLGS